MPYLIFLPERVQFQCSTSLLMKLTRDTTEAVSSISCHLCFALQESQRTTNDSDSIASAPKWPGRRQSSVLLVLRYSGVSTCGYTRVLINLVRPVCCPTRLLIEESNRGNLFFNLVVTSKVVIPGSAERISSWFSWVTTPTKPSYQLFCLNADKYSGEAILLGHTQLIRIQHNSRINVIRRPLLFRLPKRLLEQIPSSLGKSSPEQQSSPGIYWRSYS